MILTCMCKHEYQDEKYGVGKRVHNRCRKGGKFVGWRCTVCGDVKERRQGGDERND